MTQRFLPWDFETRSRTIERYGEGMIPAECTSQDWGITYDELEPFYVEAEALYGVAGPGPGMWARVPLQANQRAGVMTQAAFLSVFGKANRSSPITRGVFVLDRLLCAPPDPPPPWSTKITAMGRTCERPM